MERNKSGAAARAVLLSGGTSGIGRAAAELFVARGWRVYELSRRPEGTVAGAVHLKADVTDAAACAAAVERMLAAEGRIDVLVNNAGVGAAGAAEFLAAEGRRDMEINFFGAATLTRLVLPAMRAQGGGRIINVSSAAAFFPTPFQSYYAASKAALLAWGRALSAEIRPFGVRLTTVCPGDAATGFTAARRMAAADDAAYGGRVAAAAARMAQDEQAGGVAAVRRIAAAIVQAASARRPRTLVVPGAAFAALAWLARALPAGLTDRLVARHYRV